MDPQMKTVEAIAKLATATAADCATVATLSDTNSKLAAKIIVLNSKLMQALVQNKTFTNQLSSSSGSGGGGSSPPSSGGT